MSELVSIIIPTYNQAGFLHDALESVRAQTHADWEAVVINNHSEDDTVAVVECFADPRLKLINFANNGVIAASRNKGIAETRGRWIAFLDSDDLWRPGKLGRCLQAAAEGFDLVSHRETTFRGDRELSVSPPFTPADARYRRLLFEGTCFSPSAVLVDAALIRKIGGFSEDPALTTVEDYDLWLRLVAAGAKVRFIDDVLSDYRLHEGNNSAAVLRHMTAGINAVERHYRALAPKRPFDWLRLRRRKAMLIYGAGRGFHKAAQPGEARRQFLRSLLTFPFYVRALSGLVMTFGAGQKDTPDVR